VQRESAVTAPNKSFFSGLHLLVTTVAALVTASVAVLGLAINQGWLKSSKTTSGGAGATTVAVPQYAVEPTALSFQPLAPLTASVKVTNTGVVPFTVASPTVTGPDASHFSTALGTCTATVEPGRSCQLQVTFHHQGPVSVTATLVVQVRGAVQATEVAIQATALL
jgi:hypothetical protein